MCHRHPQLGTARTFLFVPASRPERITKAVATLADIVIVDLEDAVAPSEKGAARTALVDWLNANAEKRIAVRVNATDTVWHEDDILACSHLGVVGIMLPKAESAGQIGHVVDVSGKPVIPIIETGCGLDAIAEIASAPGCARLSFGKLDLAVELDLVPDESDSEELVFLPYRAMLVLASQRAKLPAPVDGVFTNISDTVALIRYAQRGRRHGFGGMLLIHPTQVEPASTAFTPSREDVEWAKAVRVAAAAAGGGAVVFNGRMIDSPVIVRANRILAATELATEGEGV